ncbi:Methyl sulfide methyltransferase-associated sensor [uncultured archaeon]|nr:Methyl sulfide methyltransferase-associated sensor [uncultured archaeon]
MKSLSLTQKLIIFLILISLLPYALISYINYSAEEKALEKKILDDLSALVEAKNTHISTVVDFRIEQVNEIATSNFMQEIESSNRSNLNFNLERVKKEIPVFLEINAIDRDGIIVASSNALLLRSNFSEKELFKNAKEKIYIGNMEYYDNRTGYTISSPVFNRSTKNFSGVVSFNIYPMLIYDVTSDYTGLGETGESLLVQKWGDEVVFLNPLRHNQTSALRMRFPLDSNLALPAIHAANGEKGTIRGLDYRGKDVFAAYSYNPIIDWGIVVKIDSSEALIPVTDFRNRTIALGIFYFAVMSVMAYFISRKLTDPLIRLTDASKKVAKGYLTIRIEPESSDEIGELAQSFNIMVKKLKELYEGMELKVQERTRILNRKNIELAALIKTNQSISKGLDLNNVLDTAVREVVRIVNVSYCSIILVDEGKNYGTVTSEYSSLSNMEPSPGERIDLEDCPILNEAYQEKQYVLLEDTEKAELSSKEKETFEKLKMRSILVMPIVAGEKTKGIMQLSSIGELKNFSEEEISISQAIASQVAIAIENAHLFTELKQHDETIETLFEIDRVVSQSLDLDELLKEAIAKTVQVTSSDAGWIYLLGEDGETLSLKTYLRISDELAQKASVLKVGQGVSGITVRTGNPVTMDIENYPEKELIPFLEKDGVTSIAGMPLLSKGKVLGTIIISSRMHRVLARDEIDLLTSIGNQIGVAVENARLYREAKASYEKLQKAFNELASLDRMKSDFLSNVSHELKTPLVSIRGYGELLYDGKLGILPEPQKKALEALIRNTERLTRLIDSLLFLSVQQMGKPEIRMKPLPQHVDEIISYSMADMKVMAEKKDITLIKDTPAELMVIGDRDRLTEVFINIIDNAIKFTHPRGKITVKARDEEKTVHITVTDTGIGIPENVIPSLFQRFFQADASLTRKYGGTGLGLYICKNIIDAHKGEIWIESKEGVGTTVHIRLPKKS